MSIKFILNFLKLGIYIVVMGIFSYKYQSSHCLTKKKKNIFFRKQIKFVTRTLLHKKKNNF